MVLKNVTKIYTVKNKTIYALDGINLDIDENKPGFYVIKGHSGSGKTTLIQIIGLLNDISGGSYELDGISVNNISEKTKADLRLEKFGFVFQSYKLIPHLNAFDNVLIPMVINKKISVRKRKELVISAFKKVGLENRFNHYPKELSGGEKQRVAIARALINDPKVILADEPTGNLDEKTEKLIFELFKKISKEKCVIVVSHNPEINSYADKTFIMKEGKINEI